MRSSFLTALFGGAALGLAWNFPNQCIGAALGWIAAYALVKAVSGPRPLLSCYLLGLVFHPFGFYWLIHTISHFGGFPVWAAALIFALFCTVSALQFLLYPLFYKLLPQIFDSVALRIPVAWCLSEFLAIKIFPWHLGHTQLAVTPFIQVADIGGSIFVSGLMIWIVALICAEKKLIVRIVPASLVLVAILCYGYLRMSEYGHPYRKPLNVTMVQANIPLEQKHDQDLSGENIKKHLDLSKPSAEAGSLIIWPETAVMEWLYDDTGRVERDRRLPFFGSGEQWLIGALTFQDREHIYNSSVAIFQDGKIPEPYHKKILMPFGEYTPFGEYLPWLKAMNATAADFTAGTEVVPFSYPYGDGDTAKIATLICYEDIVSSLGREAAQNGAELLVNQTNDGWFGETIAPYQHHALAAFRAIENRRFLLRATNSGLTALVDPLGRTTDQLPPFSEGVIRATVYLLNGQTLYNTTILDYPYWFFTILICCTILIKIFKRIST